jgi:aryl-alcohol dehydrogenase-like predicted oxidoreductase
MVTKRVLGSTGFQVTAISFGAWQIGGSGYGQVSNKDAQATIAAYLEKGGNFIDTARRYGESECILGDFFQQNGGREDVFIASKTHRLEAAAIRRELEETLHRLKSDYVDLYYLHAPPDDPAVMNRVLDVYEQLKQEGKIRAIGASIKGADVTQGTVDLCRQYIRSGRVDALMVIYSIFRQKNAEVFRDATEAEVGIVVRTVLESGFLTGKYRPGHTFAKENDHRRRWGETRLANILECAGDLKQWAVVPPYESLAQVAIRFALDEEGVPNVVVGARAAQQIKESMAVASLPPLRPELRERLVKEYKGRTAAFNTGA